MAKFEPYNPKLAHKSLNAVDIPMWILTKFAAVDEIRERIAKNQSGWCSYESSLGGIPAPVHWLITDQSGKNHRHRIHR